MAGTKTVLNAMSKQNLEWACIFHSIEFKERETKAVLVEKLLPTVSDEKSLDAFYPYMSDEEIGILKHYLTHKEFAGIWDDAKLRIFESIGFMCRKGDDIIISDVLANYIQKPHYSLEQKRRQFDLIIRYFTACSNLYGIFPYDLAIDYYCKYEHKRLKKRDILDIINIIYAKFLPFEPEDEFIVNAEVYLVDDDFCEELFDEQANKPYAILPKSELLNYLDKDYVPKNKYYRQMSTFLSLTYGISKIEADDIAFELSHMARAQVDTDMVFELLDDFDICFSDQLQLNSFFAAYQNLCNNTRLWHNCGHTPNELREKMLREK